MYKSGKIKQIGVSEGRGAERDLSIKREHYVSIYFRYACVFTSTN